jgi:hypothetical protein
MTIEIYIDEQSEGQQTYFEEIRQLYYRVFMLLWVFCHGRKYK